MTDVQLEQAVAAETVAVPSAFPPADLRLYRFSVQSYHALIQAGIPVYWILNLDARKLEIYSQPGGSGTTARYAHRIELDKAGSVEVTLGSSLVGSLAVREMLH